MKNSLLIVTCMCLGLSPLSKLIGQTFLPDTNELNNYKQEARSMVSFLEFTLNALGDPQSTPTQKETIIQESYLKAFRDAEVQIEDDLVEQRATVTNKDVQAYLKDVDFFFKEARFEFQIEEVTHEINEEGELYFRVAGSRNLFALTIQGDTLNNSQERFIEINLDQESRNLKIASMYTSKLSELEDLRNWWNDMPPAWQKKFEAQIYVNDSLNLERVYELDPLLEVGDTLLFRKGSWMTQENVEPAPTSLTVLQHQGWDTVPIHSARLYQGIRAIQNLEELNLAGAIEIDDLSPISKMTRLKRINLAGTSVRDLIPLRNLTKLEVLNFAQTHVKDLSPLRYAISLQELNAFGSQVEDLGPVANFSRLRTLLIGQTSVEDLSPLAGLGRLKELNIQKTNVSSLAPIGNLSKIEVLKISQTGVEDLLPLVQLKNLQTLLMDNTRIGELSPIGNLPSLRVINCEQSQIRSIAPLLNLPKIRKIYCDDTGVRRQEALQFMAQKPQCLVVYESTALRDWWLALSPAWKEVFHSRQKMDPEPNREQLHRIVNMSVLDISNNQQIRDLAPLRMLGNLNTLACAGVPIDTLGPLSDLIELEQLDCSGTQIRSIAPLQYIHNLSRLDVSETIISDLTPLKELDKLEWINLEQTGVSDLSPLVGHGSLKKIQADRASLTRKKVQEFVIQRNGVLVIWQSATLSQWWQGLAESWKKRFAQALHTSDQLDTDALHRLSYLTSLSIENDYQLRDIGPLREFLALQFLRISGTSVQDLSPLADLPTLKGLELSQNPVLDLSPIGQLRQLESLDLEGSPVDDLEPIIGLRQLTELRIASTNVKDLRPLSNLKELRSLDCSNTPVRRLSDLDELKKLKQLRCFNTRISSKQVEKFQTSHPNCEVIYY